MLYLPSVGGAGVENGDAARMEKGDDGNARQATRDGENSANLSVAAV